MRHVLALWRLCSVLGHLLAGAWTLRFTFPRLSKAEREARVKAWAQQLLQRMGIALQLHGAPAAGPVLLAANHISWLDIVVMHAAGHCRFISKSAVRHWPLIGLLASGAGTLFIERESRRDAMRVVHHMAECLQAGDVLAVFPEGTTGNGLEVLPFHANLLQAAIVTGAPVQPVALRFVDAQSGQTRLEPCYVGDDTLLESLWRTLASSGLQAVLRFGEPQAAQGRERRQWAADLRESIIALR
jgi:1-acyl-sn-glycerol-3-phosphate acyltransferase